MGALFGPNTLLGRWLAFLLDAALVSIAWAVCSIPLVTIGASTSALHYVARNWMLERSGCSLADYIRAFRANLKGGTAVWLCLLLPLAVILGNGYLVWLSPVVMPGAAGWMTLLTAFLWMAAVYAFALQASFENPPLRTVGNALRIAASHLPVTLALVLLFGFAIFCTILFPWGCIFYVPACVFLSARPTWNIFSRIQNDAEPLCKGENCEGE